MAFVTGLAILLAGVGFSLPLWAQVTFAGAATPLGTGFSSALGVAADGSGNFYGIAGGVVVKFTPQPDGSYAQSTIYNIGTGYAYSLAADSAGNVYVPVASANAIVELTPAGGSYSATTLPQPAGVNPGAVAVDAGGNLYVAGVNPAGGAIYRETLSSGVYTTTTIVAGIGGLSAPGIAVDTLGNVYLADSDSGQVYLETPGGGGGYTQTSLGSGFASPAGVAVDGGGNVYVADAGSASVFKETPSGGGYAQSILGAQLLTPNGVAVDPSGNVAVAGLTGGFVAIHTANVPFGTQAIASSTAATALSFQVAAGSTIGSAAILTTGLSGMDFTDAGSSNCTPQTFGATAICTVNVTFSPLSPGLRRGAVVLLDNAGNVLASVPIFGTGLGPQTVASPAAVVPLSSPVLQPYGIAVDAAGNLYVADDAVAQVYKVYKVTASGAQSVSTAGVLKPLGIALDGAGNLYIADSLAHAVWQVTPGGIQTAFLSGLTLPYGVAADGAGNLYVADASLPYILKVAPSGAQTQLGYGFSFPTSLTVDNAGNVYVSDTGNGNLDRIAPDGTVTILASGLNLPAGVAVDAAGNVYVDIFGSGQVMAVAPDGGRSILVANGVTPFGLAIEGNGNLFYADSSSGVLAEINRAAAPSLSFVNTPMGNTSTDSAKAIGLENIGNASLEFSAIAYPADFPESTTGTSDCGTAAPLVPGASCTLTVNFSPVKPLAAHSTLAPLSESISVTSNNLNAPLSLQSYAVRGNEIPSVASARLVVTLHSAKRLYGGANPTFTPTISGLLNGDTVVVTPQTVGAGAPVGTYPVSATVSGPNAAHYTVTVVGTTLKVTPAPLYIQVGNVTSTYGQTPPQPMAYKLYGFVNGDSPGIVSGSPVFTSPVTSATPAGSYAIGTSAGTLSAPNYFFVTSYSGVGRVAVGKATLVVTGNNVSMKQGSAVPALTYSFSGFVNGDTAATAVSGMAILSTPATSASKPGRYPINGAALGSLASANYSFHYVPGVLTVTP